MPTKVGFVRPCLARQQSIAAIRQLTVCLIAGDLVTLRKHMRVDQSASVIGYRERGRGARHWQPEEGWRAQSTTHVRKPAKTSRRSGLKKLR